MNCRLGVLSVRTLICCCPVCTTAPFTLPCSAVIKYIHCYTSSRCLQYHFSLSGASSQCRPHTTYRCYQQYSAFSSACLPAQLVHCATPLHWLIHPPHAGLSTLPTPILCMPPLNSFLLLLLLCALVVSWKAVPHCQTLSVHCYLLLTKCMLVDHSGKAVHLIH